jgi:hypothetical protein
VEILETALDDIQRINSHNAQPCRLIHGIIQNSKKV